jgi:hypothetical protein
MKKFIGLVLFYLVLIGCSSDSRDPDRFRNGVFEIPEGKGYKKTIIIRNDSIQIEKYEDKIDTLHIEWESNFTYTLKMLHPETAIDEDPIHVKITRLKKNSYEFEAVIGHSNFIQKGTLRKISN